MLDRRTFLAALPVVAVAASRAQAAPPDDARRRGRDLAGLFGITTGSFMQYLRAQDKKFVMLDLPRIMRDELDLKVIDLMTATLPYQDADYCERFHNAADKAGRIVTNLKMNLDVDIASADETERRPAVDAFKKAIDAAARLGCRWVRPATTAKKPDLSRLISGLRELCDYAEPKGISLLVENNGWMKNDVDALPRVVAALEGAVAAQPDTGNWTEAARYEGLKKAFPLAASCDFKALKLGPRGEHADYDLRRCFDIAWQAGYRGPWCFEHFNDDLPHLFRDFVQLREMLTRWTTENNA